MCQCAGKLRARQAAVAADGDAGDLARPCLAAQGVTDGAHGFCRQRFVDDAADVVGLENFRSRSMHGWTQGELPDYPKLM